MFFKALRCGPLAALASSSSRTNVFHAALSSSASSGATLNSLLEPEELVGAGGLGTPSSPFKFLDGSWHMNKARNGRSEFDCERLPGAQFFDIDRISDTSSGLPHMLPTESQFGDAMTELGISNEDHIVVYTTAQCFSASRTWWTLRAFGHQKVSILNGGLEAWKRAGGKTDTDTTTGPTHSIRASPPYVAKLDARMVVDWREVLSIVESGSAQIADARSLARFLAEAPEPRDGLVGGHIPGSLSLPFTNLVKEDDPTTFRSKEQVRDALVDSGIVLGSRVVLSCGSGVTACVIAFGLDLIGKDLASAPVYDGSWSEWGDAKLSQQRGLPIVGKKK